MTQHTAAQQSQAQQLAAHEKETITVGLGALRIDDVVKVARGGAAVEISQEALDRIATTRKRIDDLANEPTPVYGVSTGFGALARRHIPSEMRAQLQRSLVRSHAAGSGPEVEREVIRALMLLRLSTLCTGHTGVRPVVAETYAAVLNAGITPVVYEYGSLGCSGDLAPLSHCALALLGEGEVRVNGADQPQPAATALADAGITPLELEEKEGLALINGTDGMLGMLCLAIADLQDLAKVADISTAMTVEGLHGTLSVFDDKLQKLRPHPGQASSARNIRTVAANSPLLEAAQEDFKQTQVQDAYSVRCSPQVTGGFRDTITHAITVAERELAAAVDNPVVIDGEVRSNGNFHGAPVAYVLDFLAIVAADLASISERRTDRFLDTARNRGLPAFLADDPGVDSGHMIAQYTQAGIVSELKRAANPASADSIPSSAMQEDHVSMGWSAGRKLRTAVDGLQRVLAIEYLTAARAITMRCRDAAAESAPGTKAAIALLREGVEGPTTDRYLAPEIAYAHQLVASGALVASVEGVVGTLD
ncbi:histidine ammonia-lyase [Corynebacterium propinquum]|uniref:Histidine ammonia-lyase n=1 Tax=Corynebacterium propinquum TaxID=43769 RepID=A0AAP4BTT7_9CORY|nr:histidine ammonia-lyase [Corynebacterium propinquum]MCT1818830.1 histidine ammonia-lyase [Corynebacterium propinquum]MDK4257633.1 histidine ammonia-lyase [Corynebacterium propinquum]MDK4291976.1 histidine ammonia-lyase [Corynebacterium propinquum]MDK4298234.1 histidine ammonia-lyase [Corynebacterium propinquum]MDK4303219.1 histidine ammonia-lyase [Corynebacterium propinquum]